MANLFNGYSFLQLLVLQRGIIASGKLRNHEYFLITVLFVKTKKMSVKKSCFYFVQFMGFSAGNLLQLFKNGL